MDNKIGRVYLRGSNEVFSLRFFGDSRVRHETPEEARRAYRPKCDYNNKDVVNSLNIQSDNNESWYLWFRRILTCYTKLLGVYLIIGNTVVWWSTSLEINCYLQNLN